MRVPPLVCLCLLPGVFLSSSVSGACPVTTDLIMRVNVRTTSIHQYINTSIHQNINTSIHQYINTSIHQNINTSTQQYINTSTQQYINTSMHQCINTSIHQYISSGASDEPSNKIGWRVSTVPYHVFHSCFTISSLYVLPLTVGS